MNIIDTTGVISRVVVSFITEVSICSKVREMKCTVSVKTLLNYYNCYFSLIPWNEINCAKYHFRECLKLYSKGKLDSL